MVSILKKLEREPYKVKSSGEQGAEFSIDEVVEAVREKILEDFPTLVIEARVSRQKRQQVLALISSVIVSSELYVPKLTRQDLAEKIAQEICGLGPLDDLLDDPAITEIMVNGAHEIYVEKEGVLERTDIAFSDDVHLHEVINRIVQSVGRRVDSSMPYVDARLPDGSRVNAIIPPLALNGPVLTIRRFPKRFGSFSELVDNGTISEEAAEFLERCVPLKLDIVVSGGSGSGKTTILNVLSNSVALGERIIVIEDSSEISIDNHHVVYLESRPRNMEGKGEVTIRDLLRNALRMRPDRLIIGECRGKETFDLISAMNTGHDGCLSTVHANSSRDCLERILGMALTAEEGIPVEVLQSWIAIGVDVVVHTMKTLGGRRVVSEISVVGYDMARGLCSHPIYSLQEGLTLEFPEWFVDKVGKQRVTDLATMCECGG